MILPDNTRERAAQVAVKVKKHARPWRGILATLLALAAALVCAQASRPCITQSGNSGCREEDWSWLWSARWVLPYKVITACAATAFLIFGVVAVLDFGAKARDALGPRTGLGHAAVTRYAILLVGFIITLLGALALFKIPVGQLVVGGAITTILLGIAAQQSLGNVFAGLVLIFARPFMVGDTIVIRSGSLSGIVKGTVTEIGLAYVRIDTEDGVLQLPNSVVLNAGVGHARPAPPPGPAGPQTPPSRPAL